jgi:hypothetical protein
MKLCGPKAWETAKSCSFAECAHTRLRQMQLRHEAELSLFQLLQAKYKRTCTATA